MNDTIKGIIIGVVSSLIASGIMYSITKQLLWNLSLPIWLWLVISFGLVLLIYIIRVVIRQYRIYNLISEFTEGRFGDSCTYTWSYKRSSHGKYRAYGYEATNIQMKKQKRDNNVFDLANGHEVPEETIKMFIQLILIANIDKKMEEKLKPVLEYLHWTENSQYHNLLH